MDLIYSNEKGVELGVLKNFKLDLAYGSDENDFELTVLKNNPLKIGYFVHVENTEYGGVITGLNVETSSDKVVFKGRTWQGIMDSKVIMPLNGDYYTVDGEVQSVIQNLLVHTGLNGLFRAVSNSEDINISDYKFNRFTTVYQGILHMLKGEYKLLFNYKKGVIELEIKEVVDYTKDEQFDESQVQFNVEIKEKINHLIVLGKGKLNNRLVKHLYLNNNNELVNDKFYYGLDEKTATYENTQYETYEELYKKAKEHLIKINSDRLDVFFVSNERSYDINDVVGAKEIVTGIEVKKRIIKKIVKMNDYEINIEYKVGD